MAFAPSNRTEYKKRYILSQKSKFGKKFQWPFLDSNFLNAVLIIKYKI